jgi:uncharacterized protein (UPF0128 family)
MPVMPGIEMKVLDVEFFMKQFNHDFPVSKENVKALLNFAREMGLTVNLYDDDLNKIIAYIQKELSGKITKIEKLKPQLEQLQREEYELSTRKTRLENFINEMRNVGALKEFEEDPF